MGYIWYVNVFYYVNNDVFYCTKFVDSFTEAVSYGLQYFSDYTTKCELFFTSNLMNNFLSTALSLDSNKSMHFKIDYGTISDFRELNINNTETTISSLTDSEIDETNFV